MTPRMPAAVTKGSPGPAHALSRQRELQTIGFNESDSADGSPAARRQSPCQGNSTGTDRGITRSCLPSAEGRMRSGGPRTRGCQRKHRGEALCADQAPIFHRSDQNQLHLGKRYV